MSRQDTFWIAKIQALFKLSVIPNNKFHWKSSKINSRVIVQFANFPCTLQKSIYGLKKTALMGGFRDTQDWFPEILPAYYASFLASLISFLALKNSKTGGIKEIKIIAKITSSKLF